MLIKRSKKNPILKPNRHHSWEAEAVFNGCPIKKGDKTYLVYRALSLSHYHAIAKTKLMVSDIGIAVSDDGYDFNNRRRFIFPENHWERFGCEDPRITKLDDKYYIFYTALSTYPFSAEGIKVAVAITHDLKTIKEKHLVTPFNAKGMALFPEKIKNKIWSILTIHTDIAPARICLAAFTKESDIWDEAYWKKWHDNFEQHTIELIRRPQDHVEVGAPPLKTSAGWLLFYSYIRNYFSQKPVFGIEAILLKDNDPTKIIARTKVPLLVPEEYYEKIGLVPNITFPSGALLEDNTIKLYYGAADTTCCVATIDYEKLIKKMTQKDKPVKLQRAKNNPTIIPNAKNPWEAKAVFNPAAIYLNKKFHIIYRAMSEDNTSVFGYANSKDGINIDYQDTAPIYIPRANFEQKLTPNGNSGCEDPRVTQIDNKIYLLYTAYDGKNVPRVAMSWISSEKFSQQEWDNWSQPILISPPGLDDKDACIFPEKVKNNYLIIHRNGNDIDYSLNSSLDFIEQNWLEESRWISPRAGMWDSCKVGIAAPPIKTEAGWVMFYHGVSDEDGMYRVGAILLDLDDPIKIISRTDEPIFEPETPYELQGQVPNVVFPCGAVLLKDKFFIYYGGGDSVVGVATVKKNVLLKHLLVNKY